MKRLFTFILLATFAFSINAQRYMSVTKKDGSVTEFAVSAIDSIHFFVKDTLPEPPIVNPDNPFENGHEYVDLGLPSGTLWAKMNIGAETITDYGDYFAWGETNPKKNADGYYDDYELGNYKWYTSDTIIEVDADGFETITYDNKYTKYCTKSESGLVDNITTLELADDAAHVNWGGAWRMPTVVEINELCNNCICQWAVVNGVKGYRITSKKDASKSIFLPVAGYYSDYGNYYLGQDGAYWSSSLFVDGSQSHAYVLSIRGYNYSLDSENNNRCYGLSVRPVCSSAHE